MKNAIIKISKVIGCIILNMFIGYLLLTLVYFIPNKWLEENVKKSAADLLKQGTYPTMSMNGATIDNWTDSECISVTFNTDSNNPFYNAINAFHKGETNGVQRLYDTVYEPNEFLKVIDHSYLWHGFRIWLRPLLCVYDLSDIRYLCFIINIILFGFLCFLIYRDMGGIWGLLPFATAYLYFNFVIESVSMLFFIDINIMMISCLGVMWKIRQKKDLTFTFTMIGSVVAFSSMLILPMLTIGFPLIIWLRMTESIEKSNSKKILEMLKYSIFWLLGYALTLFSKIGISQLFINSDSGLLAVLDYSGSTDFLSASDRINKLYDILEQVIYTSKIKYDCLIMVVIMLALYIVIRAKLSIHVLIKGLPYLIVAFIPMVWVLVLAGHAHHFFTYFNFSIMIYSVLQFLSVLCSSSYCPKVEGNNKNENNNFNALSE